MSSQLQTKQLSKHELGQFLTPTPIAEFMASLFIENHQEWITPKTNGLRSSHKLWVKGVLIGLAAMPLVFVATALTAKADMIAFNEGFETPVVDSFPDTNGVWLNFGINTPGQSGSSASRGLSFIGDSGQTWTVDSGNIDIVDISEWTPPQGQQSVDLYGWERGSMYTTIDLYPGAYRLSILYSQNGFAGPSRLGVLWDGAPLATPIVVTSNVSQGW